uniref:F-box domain-containing protein n=1 Tax=Florenciella parvula TaxID=236787 RepID=A0A7S2F9Q7_9STRA|mmetsp:Transcript_1104/g.2685  ORF Transcript_1104/g.2685 Transcript_1104/m.2685 type:complete len:373 (+) Transcript_1104:180-1298(+)|eukprot:CAMPEP_0182524582 /NCGR_PEP_ID=MMETSP1323-20130603/1886_1 /TAXON_ID=236787 /ORGANISM="Florenciella parvula, Strain RCC1693" /LENGTH=372 /DNA_ID=CAMNT_0024733173 /DNA_START=178 /DNA_END=1296 /DNA_ORIENTATION=-
MPVFAPGLSFSPELVEAMESMKAADSHWVAYAYTISRQRSEITRIGRRLHDSPDPFREGRERRAADAMAAADAERLALVAQFGHPMEARKHTTNMVGRPKTIISSIPGFDEPRKKPPPKPNRKPPGPIEHWDTVLRYEFAQFLGPEEMLIMAITGSAWYELCASELLWEILCLRLDATTFVNKQSKRHQTVAVRDPGYADGRGWASACMFAWSWKEMVWSLPIDRPRFILVDFMNCPGMSEATPSRRHPMQTAMSILPKTQSAAFALGRVILLIYWDPAAAILSHRFPQLEHLRLMEQHRKQVIPDVTHFLHCRRQEDLRLNRVTAWLKLGHGFEGRTLLEHEGAFDAELVQSEEYKEARGKSASAGAIARY